MIDVVTSIKESVNAAKILVEPVIIQAINLTIINKEAATIAACPARLTKWLYCSACVDLFTVNYPQIRLP